MNNQEDIYVENYADSDAKKKKGPKGILAIIIVVLVLIVGLNSLVVTRENEYSVIKRFGKISRIEKNAGLSIKIPMIETIDKVSKQIMIYDIPASDVITSDKKTMIIDCYILYRIDDPLKFAQTLNNSIAGAENRLDTIVYNATKNIISATEQEQVINSRMGGLSFAIMENIGDATEKYGITLLTVEEKRLDLPDDNKEAVYTRMISEREKIAATYRATGEKDSQLIRNETDKEVAITLAEANAQAEKTEAEGEAEYMRIMKKAYRTKERKDFYEFVISLDAARVAMQGEDKTLVLDEDSPIAKLFDY